MNSPYDIKPPVNSKMAGWRGRKVSKLVWQHPNTAPFLDIGSRSQVTELLERELNRSIESTLETDFNYAVTADKKEYGTVFCFEVIEHILNPLLFVESIRRLMKKDGLLFLTTPCRKPHVESMHFTEYTKKSLDALFDLAELKIIDYKLIHTMPLWWHFTGFRPFYRMFFHHYHFYVLQK